MTWSHLSDVISSPPAHSALVILILYFLEYAKSVSSLELEHSLLPPHENLICLTSPWLIPSLCLCLYSEMILTKESFMGHWSKTAVFPPLLCSPTSYFYLVIRDIKQFFVSSLFLSTRDFIFGWMYEYINVVQRVKSHAVRRSNIMPIRQWLAYKLC